MSICEAVPLPPVNFKCSHSTAPDNVLWVTDKRRSGTVRRRPRCLTCKRGYGDSRRYRGGTTTTERRARAERAEFVREQIRVWLARISAAEATLEQMDKEVWAKRRELLELER